MISSIRELISNKTSTGYSKLEKKKEYRTMKLKNSISSLLGRSSNKSKSQPWISNPHDFRQVSAVIDADIMPETCRRVFLLKCESDISFGFYLRDRISIRMTPTGFEKVQSFYISGVAPGGFVESTGLLNVDDEILDVNGTEVYGKTIEQVTNLIVESSPNLILTVKPAITKARPATPLAPALCRRSRSRVSQMSTVTTISLLEDDDDYNDDQNEKALDVNISITEESEE